MADIYGLIQPEDNPHAVAEIKLLVLNAMSLDEENPPPKYDSEKPTFMENGHPVVFLNSLESLTVEENGHAIVPLNENIEEKSKGNVEISIELDPNIQTSRENPSIQTSREQKVDTSISNIQTLMHILKGNIGTGILSLPIAVRYAGLWTGLVGILCIGAVAVHCMHILVNCSHILCKRTGSLTMDYAAVTEMCLKTGPERGRRFSSFARNLINGLLIFTQIGFCCVYIIFVSSNIEAVSSHLHKDGPSMLTWQVIVTAALIPYSSVRNLRLLAPFSAFANILTITGLLIIFQYIVQGFPDVSSRPSFSSIQEIPLFFGTMIFAIEGIALVLPLENSMRRPEDFGGWTGILNLGMVCTVSMYAAMGFYGYLKFGDDVKDSISLSLPIDNWLYLSVRLMYALAIFISYNIQLYVLVSIIWPKIQQRVKNRILHDYGEYPLRIVLVLLTFGLAAVVPYLNLLIAFIGSFVGSLLTLILPAAIEVVTLAGEPEGVSRAIIVKDVLIFLFGIFGCVTGTYTSLTKIIEVF